MPPQAQPETQAQPGIISQAGNYVGNFISDHAASVRQIGGNALEAATDYGRKIKVGAVALMAAASVGGPVLETAPAGAQSDVPEQPITRPYFTGLEGTAVNATRGKDVTFMESVYGEADRFYLRAKGSRWLHIIHNRDKISKFDWQMNNAQGGASIPEWNLGPLSKGKSTAAFIKLHVSSKAPKNKKVCFTLERDAVDNPGTITEKHGQNNPDDPKKIINCYRVKVPPKKHHRAVAR